MKEILLIIIPATVTIIGFIVNYRLTKNSITREINKYQGKIKLDKLLECLEEYQSTTRLILETTRLSEQEKGEHMEKSVKVFQNVLDLVFMYGSNDACKIASSWQQDNFKIGREKCSNKSFDSLCYSTILSAQICIDTTGRCNKPAYYYKMKITDYYENEEKLKQTHNNLVKDLKLSEQLLF